MELRLSKSITSSRKCSWHPNALNGFPKWPTNPKQSRTIISVLIDFVLGSSQTSGSYGFGLYYFGPCRVVSYRPSLKDIIKKQGKNRFLDLLQEYPETGVHYLYPFPFTGDKLLSVYAAGKVVIVLLVCIWCFGHWEFAIMSMFLSLLLLLGISELPLQLTSGKDFWICVLISLHLMLFSTYFPFALISW